MSKKEPIFWVAPLFDDDGVQTHSGIDDKGREHPDPVPMEVPLDNAHSQDDILRLIESVVHGQFLRQKAEAEGFDTEEEADDFEDWEDEFELSEYQKRMMEKDLAPAEKLAPSSGQPETGEAAGTASPSLSSKPSVSGGSSAPGGAVGERGSPAGVDTAGKRTARQEEA